MGYFNDQEVQAIRAYKYNGRDVSIMVKLFYRRFWDYLITFFPMWLAPNVITFAGFWFEIVSFVVSFIVSHGLSHPLPQWCCIFNGGCLFIYQTLDNLDGRQARRTGSSSALGQFFDHGCDAITGVSELCKAVASFGLGASDSFYFIFLMGIGFFLTSWEEYVTHAFYLGYVNGPDEGLTLLWIAHLAVGVRPELRQFADLPYGRILFLTGLVITVAGNVVNVLRKAIRDKEMALRGVISLIPSAISVALSLGLVKRRPENMENPFFVMSCGYVLQFLAQIIIVSFLTKRSPWKLFHWRLVILWAIQAAALVQPQLSEYEHFWTGVCGLTVLLLVTFDICVVRGLCEALGIYAFRLKKKSQ